MPQKRPFDLPVMFRRIEKAVAGWPKAAMFELAEHGFGSVFEQLVGCIVSIRTLDEVSLPASIRLLEAARTPAQLARLPVGRIDQLISPCTFHRPKANAIHDIAVRTVKDFGNDLPADRDIILNFRGVGPKCANLAIGVATGKPLGISVDIHVHRVTNRWGYVHAATPEKTMAELEAKLSKKYWLDINRLLVPFGKHICRAALPKCSSCPVLEYCRQVGVAKHA